VDQAGKGELRRLGSKPTIPTPEHWLACTDSRIPMDARSICPLDSTFNNAFFTIQAVLKAYPIASIARPAAGPAELDRPFWPSFNASGHRLCEAIGSVLAWIEERGLLRSAGRSNAFTSTSSARHWPAPVAAQRAYRPELVEQQLERRPEALCQQIQAKVR